MMLITYFSYFDHCGIVYFYTLYKHKNIVHLTVNTTIHGDATDNTSTVYQQVACVKIL